jgi:hypothetical protein
MITAVIAIATVLITAVTVTAELTRSRGRHRSGYGR